MTPKKNGSNLKRFWIPLFIFVVAVICFYKVVDHLPDVFAGILDFIGILNSFVTLLKNSVLALLEDKIFSLVSFNLFIAYKS